jgi:hypothetical protein
MIYIWYIHVYIKYILILYIKLYDITKIAYIFAFIQLQTSHSYYAKLNVRSYWKIENWNKSKTLKQ